MIPPDTVNAILEAARIEDVVGDFVTLKRRGGSFVACCPFHNEKTPSFYVTPAKGIYKCFGCGKSGSAVGFVMEYEHLGYADALRYLAKKYHIEVPEQEASPEELAAKQYRESLFLVMDFARKFYVDQLQSVEGRSVAMAYYKNRRLDAQTISTYSLGWAPSGKTAFYDAAVAAGYKAEYLLDAGLCVRKEDGSIVDKFRERVMFPIQSLSGRTIAFSGRTLNSTNPAKYVNSPETQLYHKSSILYGIFFAKSQISRLSKCIVVEGNVDMIMMHQLGIQNVVAPCGTAFTTEQMHLIHKFTDNLTTMFDGDKAGIHATLKVIDDVLSEGLNMRVVTLPDGQDPDDFCKGKTLEEVQEYISANEKDCIEYKCDFLIAEAAGDPIRIAGAINDVSDSIAHISDAIKRSVYVETVARKFSIDRDIVFDRITKTRQRLIAEAKAASERSRSAENDGDVPEYASAPAVQAENSVAEQGQMVADPILAPSEKELLGFLITNGCDALEFESDSEFYSEEGSTTVAVFIDESLQNDDFSFVNTNYRLAYDAYFSLYDLGWEQEKIVKALLDGENRVVANVVAELSSEKYMITIRKFQNSMMTTGSWLSKYVPKSILTYQLKRVVRILENLTRELANADAESQMQILRQMSNAQKVKNTINEHISKL